VIALAVLSLVAAACSSPGITTSRTDFQRLANAVCAEADAKAAKVEAPAQVDGPAIASTVASIVAIERAALRQLQKLILPPADAAAIRSWYASVRKTIDATAAVGTASGKGDFTAATAARDRGNALAATADASARSLGLDKCATPADPTTPGAASTSAG
jgi:hypothetical protein